MLLTVILVVALVLLLHYLAVKPYFYWKKKNVPTGRVFPILGDNYGVILGTESFIEMIQRLYNKVQNTRYISIYQFRLPIFLVKSPELIKRIGVKDFDHFVNHRNIFPEDGDELWSKNLIALKDQHWKNIRSTLSPSFTSSKMRTMFLLICNNAKLFVDYFLEKNEKVVEVEFKDAYSRYANDLIASLAFGLEVDSLKEKDNRFYKLGKEASNFNGTRFKTALFLYQLSPTLSKILQLQVFSDEVRSFFTGIIRDTIKYRLENNVKRRDMLGLLLETREGNHHKEKAEEIKDNSFAAVDEHLDIKHMSENLTDTNIASQMFLFFLGGFESVSTVMCFIAYELAVNPDIQEKLIQEIDDIRSSVGTPTYENIVNMTYMDMIITESLRKWPVTIATDRVVTKPYTINPESPEEKPIHLDVNDTIMIPIYSIHRDPKYYPEPEKFDPERFSPENRKSIDPYTYLPFGLGPRNCIGSRFALLEIKAIFFHLLSEFEIVPVEKTNIPLKIHRKSFTMMSENGFPLGLKRRQNL